MKLSTNELEDLIVEVANQTFGSSIFGRQPLILAVEQTVRQMGKWTEEDDIKNKGARGRSRGFGTIDYAISFQSKPERLTNLGRNRWKVSDATVVVLRKGNSVAEPPQRIYTIVSRIVRDTPKARGLKRLYGYQCQVCGLRLELEPSVFYIEVHHLRPLGGAHRGLDETTNMLVVCPNHHAMFDLGVPRFLAKNKVRIGGIEFNLTARHDVAQSNINYYAKNVWRKNASSSVEGVVPETPCYSG